MSSNSGLKSITGLKSSDRVAVFIDGANIYATAKACGFDIDYKKLRGLYESESNLVRMFYYTAMNEDEEFTSIRPLIDYLDYNGYSVVTKPTKEFVDSMGRRKLKGNMDIELAIDALELAPHLDEVVLFTGDGDFRSLVEAIQRKGRRVTVVSALQGGTSQTSMVADELRRQADRFINLNRDGIDRPLPAFTQQVMRPAQETQERRQRRADQHGDGVASFVSSGAPRSDVEVTRLPHSVLRRGPTR